jgi:hypothetical protein
MAVKQMKMPMQPAPKAEPAASSNTQKMTTKNVKEEIVTEAEGSIPKTPREKELAAMHGHKKRITFGDVMKARGVGMKKEEVELIDELSKSTLGSYVKKAAADSTISRKIGADFEHQASKARSTTMKAASTSLADKFKSDARKRKVNVDKAVDRLTKEEAEQTQEGWDDMMKSVNATKGTGKFDKKEVKPGVTQYTRKSSTFDDGTGKDSDERRQDRERRKAVKEENMDVKEASSKEEHHDTISYPLSKVSFKEGMKYASGTSGTVHNSKTHHVKETEAGNNTDSNIVYGIHHKATGKIHGVSISAFKKTTPEKVAKATGSSTVNPAHKALAAHHNETTYVKENKDTPGNSYEHQCAIHVKSESFGEGRTLTSQHAEPDAQGNIAWYDVMFAEGIHRVETKDIEVLVSEAHMMHKKKKKAM